LVTRASDWCKSLNKQSLLCEKMLAQAAVILAALSPLVLGKSLNHKRHTRDAIDFFGGIENVPTLGKGAPMVRKVLCDIDISRALA
jgi:hypothetical protein